MTEFDFSSRVKTVAANGKTIHDENMRKSRDLVTDSGRDTAILKKRNLRALRFTGVTIGAALAAGLGLGYIIVDHNFPDNRPLIEVRAVNSATGEIKQTTERKWPSEVEYTSRYYCPPGSIKPTIDAGIGGDDQRIIVTIYCKP